METLLQYLLLALALTSVQISYAESRLNEKRRDKTERRHHAGTHLKENICEITDRESKVHCYCENTDIKTATRADCWVFNGGIAEADPLWSTFNSQPHLEKLTFNVRSDGALTFIPLHVVYRLKRLQKLSIHYATLNKIEKRVFSNLTNIKEISLMNDKISELDFSAFANLISLVNLTVKENKITELQRDVFVDLPSLRYLDMSFNNINVVHDGCFEHLTVLNDLVLESNSLGFLTRDTFRGLANLTRLDLRTNKLSVIDDFTFSELWNLNELLLDNNELSYLSKRAFEGLAQLEKLSMTGNKMKSINEELLMGVRGLQLLDLRNNELEYFTFETIKPILDNLKMKTSVLYLSGNKLTCDCRLLWISTLKNETKSEPLRLALDDVTCLPTSSLNEIPNGFDKGTELPSTKEYDDNGNDIQMDESDDNRILSEVNEELREDEIVFGLKGRSTSEPVFEQLKVTNLSSEDLPCETIKSEDSPMLSDNPSSSLIANGSTKDRVVVLELISVITLLRLLK